MGWGSFKKSFKKFVSNPGRVVAAAATFGTSEIARSQFNKAMDQEAPAPEMPVRDMAGDAQAVAEAEAEQRVNSRRGRASTILTGGQGLSGSGGVSMARRTLIGY